MSMWASAAGAMKVIFDGERGLYYGFHNWPEFPGLRGRAKAERPG